MSHKKLDAQWNKLSLADKQYAISKLTLWKEWQERNRKIRAEIQQAEEGKRVGYECTCRPDKKNSIYLDDLCSYCQAQHWKNYYNSPG